MSRPTVLYVSNLAYPAKGRRYCDEDIYLTSNLRHTFDLAITHPEDATRLMRAYDTVVVRNSGPVIDYPAAYATFRAEAGATGQRVYNPLTGKADMAGKQYLVDLANEGYPVIPTIDDLADLAALDRLANLTGQPVPTTYVVKPKAGADSHGLEFHTRESLESRAARNRESTRENPSDTLVQPKIDFRYEVSFYFVDHDFQYALHAPDPAKRWELTLYTPSGADLEFARKFITWNALPHGVQRVDACRTQSGDLLLVELEDLNPYLSLDRTTDDIRTRFVQAMTSSLLGSLA
ncbi:hypothetical protein [Lentzea sp. NBRC 102530]|uniref:hypothetical protein n=1 Tax=Lentzea sp. NBRC 102530 TaxID=3032201 RepID=UPI0024A125B1|nr:hypothetical protein [Lentzea sp. NBRC 102530]GLY52739.1 hypothetical protein Lesp01_63950 [Lentzea sp. NBRC 102530]